MYTKSYQEKRRRIVRRFTQFVATYPPALRRQVKLRSAAVAFLASIPEPHHSPVHTRNDVRVAYRFTMADLCKQFGAKTTIDNIIEGPAQVQKWLESNR